MYDFAYHRPSSLPDAAKLLDSNPDAKLLAGGMTLLPTMKLRLARPSDLVDLCGLSELSGIRLAGGELVIGAMTTHDRVAASPDVRKAIPALAELAGLIGDPHVRNRGTIGGSVANADPAADYPAGLVGLGATVHTTARSIPADAFFTGLFTTALEPAEIVTAVSFPVPERAGYAKFPNPASRFALVGVLVSKGPTGVRVAVTGAGPKVFRVPEIETLLAKDFAASLAGLKIAADGLNDDIHAGPAYRAHLIGVMAGRARAKALDA